MTRYARPETLTDALQLLEGGTWRILAGGTDLYPGAGAELAGDVLDIGRVPGLRGISLSDGLRIGAATTWSDIAAAPLPPALFALQQAAVQVGARQVQNTGTIGGNLCNASPAADGVPPLLTLDAEVELASPRGIRRLALADFIEGPRRTACAPDEILTAVHVPKAALQGRASFLKLGARAHLVISIVMVACRVVEQDGRVAEISLAAGSCSPVARRLSRVEAALLGQPMAGLAEKIRAEDVAAHLAPIEDIRASAGYRLEAATELLRRVLGGLA
jgi:CO/xanthine dehydrogenase FAD-binding subunit